MEEKRGDAGSITNKLILKKAVEVKIKRILEKAFISEREAYDLVRDFFKKYLLIDYEFTTEELLKELRRVYVTPELHARIKLVLERVAEIEHLSRSFSKPELEALLNDFKAVVDALIVFHYDKKSFFKKLRDSLHRSVSDEHKNVFETDEAALSENERAIVKMNMLLDNAKRWSDKDITRAKQAYKELLEIYDQLEPERKKSYYEPINELFVMIKHKESIG
jgi:hypothetical protein